MKGGHMHSQARASVLILVLAFATGSSMAGACSVGASGMAFGQYQPLTFAGKLVSTDRLTDATVSVACTAIVGGGSYTIALGPSTQGNSIVPRYLSNDRGGAAMAYNVYLDGGQTTVWGDGVVGAVITGSIPAGDSSRTHIVFGKVPAGQNTLGAGSYSGLLTMTITYNP